MTLAFPRIETRGSRAYELVAPWECRWEALGAHRVLRIAAPFPFDGASVPRIFWSLIAPGDLLPAACAHDFLYQHGGACPPGSYLVDGKIVTEPWSRRDADRLFGAIMRDYGVPPWRRAMAYRAVRVFGWRFFGRPEAEPLLRRMPEEA